MSSSFHTNYFENLSEIVRLAITEDVGTGDITAELVPEQVLASATVISREEAIVCGRPWVDEVFRQIDSNVNIVWLLNEGDKVLPNQEIIQIEGNARSILSAERCALNFLQTLMGTATTSYKISTKFDQSDIRILDTRKTLPGLRLAQKYAVKIGGCENHRIGLYDAFLIKENHITACGSIQATIAKAKILYPKVPVEIEVESIDELKLAMTAGADRIMLDNFSDNDIQEAVEVKNDTVEYEISGNIDLSKDALQLSKKIDFISSGALTKHCHAIDLSMRLELRNT